MNHHARRWARDVPDAPKVPIKRGTARRIAGLFRPYRRPVLAVASLILLTSGLGVANPLLIKAVFDRALFPPEGTPNMGLLYVLVAFMVAIPASLGGLGVLQTYLANLVGQRVMRDLREALYEHLQRMSLRFFTGTRTGEIQSRLANDVGGVQSVVTDTASSIMSNVVVVTSTLIAMLILSWQLTALSLCLTPVFLYLTYRVGKKRRELAAKAQQSKAEMSAITEETLSVSGILLAKVFDRQQDEIARFRSENRKLVGLEIQQQMAGRTFFAAVQIFFSITPALVYLAAGLALSGDASIGLTAGSIVAFTTLQSRLFFPIGQLLQVSVEIQASLALFQRIFEYLDLPVDIEDRAGAMALSPREVQGTVELDGVSFRYDHPEYRRLEEIVTAGSSTTPAGASPLVKPTRSWAIEDLSLRVEPGQLAALVGPSGAGKTTISYLVPRLYDVDGGAVRIDGHDVRDIQLRSLAEIVGMVTQETYLFHASIRKNLLYARPDATEDEVIAAARAANIHDRIMELEQGYDTVVGERGYRMSGGEKQRLAIARVVLKDPRILILDEATSALDSTSERLVQAALQPLMAGRTTIAIAHRLSTILRADVIFVLDRGHLVEQGTHAELVRRGGLYADLYEQQFQGGLVEAQTEDGVVLANGRVLSTAHAG